MDVHVLNNSPRRTLTLDKAIHVLNKENSFLRQAEIKIWKIVLFTAFPELMYVTTMSISSS